MHVDSHVEVPFCTDSRKQSNLLGWYSGLGNLPLQSMHFSHDLNFSPLQSCDYRR